MTLNQNQIETALKSVLLPGGIPYKLHLYEQVASTNQTLWELLRQGCDTGTVVIASAQTAGRGQWGRQWQSQTGGLYLSVALSPQVPVANHAQLTLCSVWGIVTALRKQQIPVQIKWPNDLVIEGQKLGGILTETRIQGETITKAVVGVGINWNNEVPPTGINLSSILAKTSHANISSLEDLATLTLQGLASGYQLWVEKGITELLTAYSAVLSNLLEPVMVQGRSGKIMGVAPTGELRVRLQQDAINLKLHQEDVAEIFLKPGMISLGYKSTQDILARKDS